MKLETLEHFLNKDQSLWNREDIDKLAGKYGNNAIFYDTEGITNRLIMLFKFRDMSMNDEKISNFMSNKNKDYLYIIDYVSNYLDCIDFVFWPSETALQVVYKILCERILSDSDIKDHSEQYIKLKQLIHKLAMIRYEWYLKAQENEKNREDSHESK